MGRKGDVGDFLGNIASSRDAENGDDLLFSTPSPIRPPLRDVRTNRDDGNLLRLRDR
jgi:hypothetical protein